MWDINENSSSFGSMEAKNKCYFPLQLVKYKVNNLKTRSIFFVSKTSSKDIKKLSTKIVLLLE